MACCDNVMLLFIFYVVISYKHLVKGTTSPTTAPTTSSASVSTTSSLFSSSTPDETSTSTSTTSPSSQATSTSSLSSSSTSTVISTSTSTTSSSSETTPTSSLSSSSTSTVLSTSTTSTSTTSPSSEAISTSSLSSSSTSTVTSMSTSATSPSSEDTSTSSFSSSSTSTLTSTSTSTTSPSSEATSTSSLSSSSSTVTSTSTSTTSPSSEATSTSSLSSLSTLTETATSVTLSSSSAAATASSFKPTTWTTPPNSKVVDLGSHTLGLNFSLKVNLTFNESLLDKMSKEFMNLSTEFTKELKSTYNNISGFKYIQINEFRNGSVLANYSVVFSATTNVSNIVDDIKTTVIEQLKALSIFGVQIDSSYINMTMQSELDSQRDIDICIYTNPKLCPYGFECQKWGSGSVLCSDRCRAQSCVHGTCYVDYRNEGVAKCRCPIDDDGYVYSGERCEQKSLSTLIIITSGVGGGVLVAAFFIICVICIKMRRKEKESDDIRLDSFPDYSKYFPRSNTYQPKYGNDLPLNREKGTESQTLDGKSGYIPSRGNFHDNMTYMYDDLDTHLEDNNGEVNRERHQYDYIEMDKKFELRRPQLR